MTTIKCCCLSSTCTTAIRVENNGLWFIDKDGRETLMYVDPNTLQKLIAELRDLYISMLCPDQEKICLP